MHFEPEIKWCVVFTQIHQQLPVSAKELLTEEKMTAAADKLDSTFARWTYAHYFQFLRDKDVKKIIVTCHFQEWILLLLEKL